MSRHDPVPGTYTADVDLRSAARADTRIYAIGLDVGAMSGFDNAGVDKEFFAGTTFKSNFICNVGYGDPSGVMGRLPRFAFDEIAKIV